MIKPLPQKKHLYGHLSLPHTQQFFTASLCIKRPVNLRTTPFNPTVTAIFKVSKKLSVLTIPDFASLNEDCFKPFTDQNRKKKTDPDQTFKKNQEQPDPTNWKI